MRRFLNPSGEIIASISPSAVYVLSLPSRQCLPASPSIGRVAMSNPAVAAAIRARRTGHFPGGVPFSSSPATASSGRAITFSATLVIAAGISSSCSLAVIGWRATCAVDTAWSWTGCSCARSLIGRL
jgi:hypothetical protein